MKGVWLRTRSTLVRRWSSTVAVALVVALVGAIVLTLVAGAHRTAAAPGAFTRAVGGDPGASVQQRAGKPQTAEVARLPGVEAVEGITFVFAGFADDGGASDANTLSFAGDRHLTTRLVDGRPADPTEPHEFVADQSFVSTHHAHVGSRFRVVTWTQKQAETGQAYVGPPMGSFEATLVGVINSIDHIESHYSVAFFSPALLHEDVGVVATIMSVRLEPGVTRQQLRTEIDRLPGGRNTMSVATGQLVSAEVRNAVDAQALGTWLMAAVAAIVGAIALGQLLSRHTRIPDDERRSLVAIGSTRRELAVETLLRSAVPAVVGLVLGAVVAVLASGIFPVGFTRAIEPHPGIHVDTVALLGTVVVLLVALLAFVQLSTLLAGRERVERVPSRTGEALARRAPNAAAATGARFALTNADGSSASARGTIAGLALVLAGVIGATVFAASLERLVTQRSRFGSNYTVSVASNSDLPAARLRALFANDRDVAGVMILSEAEARRGQVTVPLIGFERVRGNLAPRVLAGRLPSGDDEVALGRQSERSLDLGVGDRLALDGASGHAEYRVVGSVVVPTVGGNDGVGKGALLTSGGLARVQKEPSSNLAALQLRRDSAAIRKRIGKAVDGDVGEQDVPGVIANVARVRSVPAVLAVLLVVIAMLTMAHALIVSIQRRRRDLAVLRALGANRRWVARTVHWHATVLALLPLVAAIPLGLVAGAALFRTFVDHIGALPDAAYPVGLLALTVFGLLALANVAAIFPARRARNVPAARLLSED